MTGNNYSDIIVGDEETIGVDYANLLPPGETITGAVWTNSALSGDDQAGADAMFVNGTAGAVAGAVVSVRVKAFVGNAFYRPRCTATFSDGQVVTLPDAGSGFLHTAA